MSFFNVRVSSIRKMYLTSTLRLYCFVYIFTRAVSIPVASEQEIDPVIPIVNENQTNVEAYLSPNTLVYENTPVIQDGPEIIKPNIPPIQEAPQSVYVAVPAYYYIPNHQQQQYLQTSIPYDVNHSNDLSEQSDDARINPWVTNLIFLPKIILQIVKSLIKSLGIGFVGLLLSTLLCTFTPICLVGAPVPDLVERSGRAMVSQISDESTLSKIDAAVEILSNVLDKYAKIKMTQAKKGEW